MSYPNQPQQPYAQPGYAPQPPAPQHYAPNTAYTQPQPGYAQTAPPPQYFQQPQQPYYQPQPPPGYTPAPPPPPRVNASIEDFYNQPTGSGKFISFKDKQPGYRVTGIVARPITRADIRQQTDMITKVGLVHGDGAPKLEMIVPLRVNPSPEFPDGTAAWCVKGKASNELKRAVGEAGGDPNTPPEPGAGIDIVFLGKQAVPGTNLNPANVIQVTYTLPANAPAQPQHIQQQIPADPQQFAQMQPSSQPQQQQQFAPQPQFQQAAQQQLPQQAPQAQFQPPPAPTTSQAVTVPPMNPQVMTAAPTGAPGAPGQPMPASAPTDGQQYLQQQYAQQQQQQQQQAIPQNGNGFVPQGQPQPPADLTADQQQLLNQIAGYQR